ncbi:MAG: class I SAM-dependent methyltransferase [Candidatus Micrarchaeaceae archaeon]|jgi:ubiquinone/menaquinone biosynthesis C-methylase UbiE
MVGKKNIIGWEEVVSTNSKAYNKWFTEEKKFLNKTIKKDASVLEVGCGYGRSLFDIIAITNNLIGIDNDKIAIKHAKIKLKKFPYIKLLVAEGKNLPFKDNSFDYVLCLSTFANFYNDKYKILGEMRRVLKNEGSMIISVYSENALKERLRVYRKINTDIKEVKPNGTVVFDDFGVDGFSEQFSKNELLKIFKKAKLKVISIKKVTIAYICKLSK